MVNPSQLFLLADHIKLSLLERQRAISLNLEPSAQDGNISRSLESFDEGLRSIVKERKRLEDNRDPSSSTLKEQETHLHRQYEDLVAQFRGFPASASSITHPNDPSLSADFARALDSRPRNPSSSSFLKRSAAGAAANSPKSVRFSDSPLAAAGFDAEAQATRDALFPYRDDPDGPPDQSELTNQQIHSYHKQVMQEQDEQLDRLGESIGRQRELSIQIGDELDSHVQLLDEVDEHVDRHQTRLDGARKRLTTFNKKARDNMQLTIILILIIILVLLIIILK
ncbi:MAG: hypothetical protein M1829_004574 [Trizodia sp. TS-e1964]|nr:MAG: hypothetical protein M1829_004574 [Trizodia sp. TS-e1964]